MTQFQKTSLFLLRISMGWLMLYAGVTKLLNPEWTAAGYLKNAQTFAGFYEWLLRPNILQLIDFINEWGLTLLGISLILGAFVRLSSLLGAILMMLYYFPVLSFPYIAPHSYLIDDHIIYTLVLLFFAAIRAGKVWGLDTLIEKLSAQHQSFQRWFL